MKVKLTIIFLLAVLFIIGCAPQKRPVAFKDKLAAEKLAELSLIPLPMQFQKTDGKFVLDGETRILMNSLDENADYVSAFLLEKFNRSTGFNLQLSSVEAGSITANTIAFTQRDIDDALGEEGYSLQVKPEVITVASNSARGLFYGAQTLLQLLPAEIQSDQPVAGVEWTIPCVEIVDKPRFQWRGAHLDVCRHFFSKEFVKKYIDILAMHKLNVFHWHLTEDQGWRIEIKKNPKLTEIGAWRADRAGITWREREPQQPGEAATYGGYYTQEDVREIVEYAKSRFVDVLPEIEMPGHALAALASYPEYSCFGGPFTVATGGYWPIKDIYCAGKDETFEFLENILDEVIPLFPFKFFHIGGDEAYKENWEKCPDCQQRIQQEGLADVHELQSYFIKRIENFLNSRGKRLIGWDEILEGGLAPNAAVMSWRGVSGGIEAATAGHDVVMSPTSHCYFDYYQAKQGEPEAIGGYLPLEKVYQFEPVPEELDAKKAQHILGAQANVWTEYIPTAEHAEYMLLPRLAALSEVVWSPGKYRNYGAFLLRMNKHYDRLEQAGINFRVPTPIGFGGETVIFDPIKLVLKKPLPDAQIRFTMDGSSPTSDSPLYSQPIEISTDAVIKAKTFISSGKASNVITHRFVLVDEKNNGMHYQYYEGRWDKLPDFDSLEIKASGRCYSFDLNQIRQRDQFYGVVFKGFLRLDQQGEYKFYTISDDGSQLFIDGQLVVDNDGAHGMEEKSGSIKLARGLHELSVRYFQFAGAAELEVFWERPGQAKQPLPPSQIFFKK